MLETSLRYRHPMSSHSRFGRLPELHLAVSDRYQLAGEREGGWRAAKLVVYANGPREEQPENRREVVAGLYIEKGTLEKRAVSAWWRVASGTGRGSSAPSSMSTFRSISPLSWVTTSAAASEPGVTGSAL
jgi:hypothetical protein